MDKAVLCCFLRLLDDNVRIVASHSEQVLHQVLSIGYMSLQPSKLAWTAAYWLGRQPAYSLES